MRVVFAWIDWSAPLGVSEGVSMVSGKLADLTPEEPLVGDTPSRAVGAA